MKKFILPAAFILMMLMECSAFAAPKRISLMLEGSDTASASGFNWLCLEGMRNAQVRFGNKKLSTKYYNALDDNTKLLPLLKEAAAASDLVIITSVAYIKYLPEVMREYPACSFLTFDTNNLDGVTEIVFREEEGGFLAGALAAIMTTREDVERINDEKKIGIILGEKVPPVERFRRGYIAGAWYINPEIEVLCEYTNDFNDRAKAAEAAMKLKRLGADIIFCVNGAAGIGAIERAKEGGYWTIGVDTELESDFPEMVLTSVVKRSGHVIYKVIENFLQDNLPKDRFSLGLKDDCIDISTWTRETKQNVPLDVRKRIDELEDKVSSGLIKIKKTDYQGIFSK